MSLSGSTDHESSGRDSDFTMVDHRKVTSTEGGSAENPDGLENIKLHDKQELIPDKFEDYDVDFS